MNLTRSHVMQSPLFAIDCYSADAPEKIDWPSTSSKLLIERVVCLEPILVCLQDR